MFEKASDLAEGDKGVILDATFVSQSMRRRAAEVASKNGKTFVIQQTRCSEEYSLNKISKRTKENYESNALAPQAYYNNKNVGFFLPTLALAYQVLSVFFLGQTGAVVLDTLNLQGIADTIDLTLVYNPVVGTAFALMGITVVMLLVPMIRSLDIIEIEIVED